MAFDKSSLVSKRTKSDRSKADTTDKQSGSASAQSTSNSAKKQVKKPFVEASTSSAASSIPPSASKAKSIAAASPSSSTFSTKNHKKPTSQYSNGNKLQQTDRHHDHDQDKHKHKQGKMNGSKFSNSKGGVKGGAGAAAGTGGEAGAPAKDPKELRLERKMQSPHFELLVKLKRMWEKIRVKTIEPHARAELVTKMMEAMQGKISDVTFKHDGARIIQACIKYGSIEQRLQIFKELKTDLLELTKSKYSKFIVKRFFKYGNSEIRNSLISSLNGKVRKLIKHREAAELIETAYGQYANSAQREALLEEFYGPHYIVYKTPQTHNLGDVFAAHPEQKEQIMKHLSTAVTACLDKGTIGNSIVHKALLEYLAYASPAETAEMISSLKENVVEILHTRDGSKVGLHCIWQSNAKDRKTIVKTLKTFVKKVCCEEFGHVVLLGLFDSVDDTVLLKKSIFPEIVASLNEIVASSYGLQVLLYLLAPRSPRYLANETITLLRTGDGNPNSKKDQDIRRKELQEGIEAALIEYCAKNADSLCRDPFKLRLITEVVLQSKGDVSSVLDAILDFVDFPKSANDEEPGSLSDSSSAHRLLKTLLSSHKATSASLQSFASKFIGKFGGQLKNFAVTNFGCFILAGLLKSADATAQETAREELKKSKAVIAKLSLPGSKALIDELNGSAVATAAPVPASIASTPKSSAKNRKIEAPSATPSKVEAAVSAKKEVKSSASAVKQAVKTEEQDEQNNQKGKKKVPSTIGTDADAATPTPKRSTRSATATVSTPKSKSKSQ